MDTETLSQKKSSFIASLASPFLEFHITGLDISDLSMKYLSFNRIKKNKFAVGAYGEIAYKEGIITNGEIIDEQAFTEVLKQWYAKQKKQLPSPFVAIALPEEKSFIRVVQIPHIARREDVANAIRWEIENQIPLPLEDVMYDYEIINPLQGEQDHVDVLITAFPRDTLNAYVRAIKGAGLELYAIELEPQSLVRACVARLRNPEATIIVDVGRTRTSIVIFAAGAIFYTSTIQSGGLVFEQYIARQLNCDARDAVKIKIEIGLDKTKHNGEVFAALAPAITLIGDELVRASSYYETHASHAHGSTTDIRHVLLSGGDGNLRGLDTYLASVLRVPVERAHPFSVIRDILVYDIPPITKREALAFTTAIGLALREIRQE